MYIVGKLNEAIPGYPITVPYASGITCTLFIVMLLGVLASLKFMWDVRRA